MNTSQLIATNLRTAFLGKNWTAADLKTTLQNVDLSLALKHNGSKNNIAILTVHIGYYIVEVQHLLDGKEFKAKDELSFILPPLHTEADWQDLQSQLWKNVEKFATTVEQLPETIWDQPFADGSYGTYYRNICGITEHAYYHMGQIALLKKQLQTAD